MVASILWSLSIGMTALALNTGRTINVQIEGNLTGAPAIDASAWLRGLDLAALVGDLKGLIGSFQYNVALQRIKLDVLDAANKYIAETQPFKLAKTDPDSCRAALVNLALTILPERNKNWLKITSRFCLTPLP